MDGKGAPLPNAWVQATAIDPEVVGDVYAVNSDGRFTALLAPRVYEITVSAPGHATRHLSQLAFSAGQTTSITVNLDAANDDTAFTVETEIACIISATVNVNLRGGPSTAADIAGQLNPDNQRIADGQLVDANGFVWWRLTGGEWVRSDVVDASDSCEMLPTASEN